MFFSSCSFITNGFVCLYKPMSDDSVASCPCIFLKLTPGKFYDCTVYSDMRYGWYGSVQNSDFFLLNDQQISNLN